jgi:hypothetical protein
VLLALLYLVMGVKPLAGQVLYGFGFLPGETAWSVFSINPSTGAFTPVVPVGSVAVNTSTFDPVGKRLFFLSPPSTLYTVSLTSGAISTATVGNCCAVLEFDSLAGVLYGFGVLPGETAWSVFSINPSTGAFTPVVPVGSVVVNTSTFDPVGKRLFFLSPPSTLYTVSLTSGAISTATVGNCCAILFVGAGTSAAVPALQPLAALVLLGLLGFVGWGLVRSAG